MLPKWPFIALPGVGDDGARRAVLDGERHDDREDPQPSCMRFFEPAGEEERGAGV